MSIHSMSKSYSVTGWRIGWTIAPADLSVRIRRVHDFLTVGAAAPLQAAAVVALNFPDSYFDDLVASCRARRDALLPSLRAAGFRVHEPAGAYYVMTDIRELTDEDGVTFALRLNGRRWAPVPRGLRRPHLLTHLGVRSLSCSFAPLARTPERRP